MSARWILHVDMDAFYASVEQRDRPELRGCPVVVGGSPESRGVVAAASYEARRYGIHSAMPAAQARRRCPDAVFVRPDFAKYRAVSEQIRRVFDEVTDRVEPLALDEAFLDVTDHRLGELPPPRVARWVKAQIHRRTGLTASAGLGPSKLVAKLASDMDKPDGLVVVAPEQVEAFVAPLPARRLWGVGPVTAQKLGELGIDTVADVRQAPPERLLAALGRMGPQLQALAWGRDDREVRSSRPAKSRGCECTLARDVRSLPQLDRLLAGHAERVGQELSDRRIVGRTVTVKVRFANFRTVTRSHTLAEGTSDPERLADVGRRLLRQTDAGARPVRLVGLSVSGLGPDRARQLDLFAGSGGPAPSDR
ncbi:MAG TPA: DNA polymerase IV [Myxococcales bacterium LLY-WYZ-16_1]|nr:DNA polymerase IV [Myxococcales bacterium LLY-WYZ-16_1]